MTGRRRIEFTDGSVVELLSDVNLVLLRAGCRKIFRLHGFRHCFWRRSEVHHGNVSGDVVHDIGSSVVAVDDDSTRILTRLDFENPSGVRRVALNGGEAGGEIDGQLHQDVAGGADHEGISRVVLECHRPRLSDEELGRICLECHRAMHVAANPFCAVVAGGILAQ